MVKQRNRSKRKSSQKQGSGLSDSLLLDVLQKSSYASDEDKKRYSALPHPLRMSVTGMTQYNRAMIEASGIPKHKLFADQQYGMEQMVRRLLRDCRDPEVHQMLLSLTNASMAGVGPMEGHGVLIAALANIMYHDFNAPHFHVDDALNEYVLDTDLGQDIPATWLLSPFPLAYFELGGFPEGQGLYVRDKTTGLHVLEGCYLRVTEVDQQRDGPVSIGFGLPEKIDLKASRHLRFLEFVFTGKPKPFGSSDVPSPDNDALNNVLLIVPMDCDDVMMRDVVSTVWHLNDTPFGKSSSEVFAGQQITSTGVSPEQRSVSEHAHDNVVHVLKLLVLLNNKLIGERKTQERSEIEAQLLRAKASTKRKKLQRRLEGKADKVVLHLLEELSKTERSFDSERPEGDKGLFRTVRLHTRRGHIRQQAYGKDRALRKIKWIKPTLVGQGIKGRSALRRKYDLKK